MRADVRRATDRFRTRRPGGESWHSFSFGAHYDPGNVSFGALLAVNEERLEAGAGFGPHPHVGIEIVTWVVSGQLRHEDSAGHDAVVGPVQVQRLYAGSGVTHSERATADGPVRLVQMWLAADLGGPPEYEVAALPDPFPADRTVPVAAHRRGAAVLGLRRAGATLHAARLSRGGSAPLPPAPLLHVQVVTGQVELVGVEPAVALAASDTARIHEAVGLSAQASPDGAEILVWVLAELPG